MTSNRRSLSINILNVLDLCVAVFSLGVTTVYIVHEQNQMPLDSFLSMRIRISNFIILMATLLIYHVIFRTCGMYHSRRLTRKRVELVDAIKASTMAFAALVIC